MKMLYYVSEDIQKEGMSFANHLIKRADTYEEAVEAGIKYCLENLI